MKIEIELKEDVECNWCGKVGGGRYLIWLDHLCKHFIGLCPIHFGRFISELIKFRRNENKK